MKISNKLVSLIVGVTLSLTAFASAAVGSGVRGGGHTIDVDSTPYLMDLVSKAVCEWKTGKEIMAELPTLRETLKKLEALDWYFASDFESEIEHLNFCMTGPLYKVPAYEAYSVTRHPEGERTRQTGYRWYENVYIDTDIYSRMNEVNRSMLIAHETMHSYLSMYTLDRSLKLRSMVKTFDRVRQEEVVTREKLHYDMKMNEIMFPLAVDVLDGKKEAVLFLKGSMAYKKASIMKLAAPEDLINLTDSQLRALAPWDANNFYSKFKRASILEEALSTTMQRLSPKELGVFLQVKVMKTMNLVKIALNDFYTFSSAQKAVILSSPQFNKMLDSGFDGILNTKLKTQNYLILAPVEFQLLVTGEGEDYMPVVRLVKASTLPSGLIWLVEAMITLKKSDSLEAITKNEKFYSAMGLKNQKEQVRNMPLKIERERKVALENLDNLSYALVEQLLQKLHGRLDEDTYSEMMKQINFNNF